VAVLPVDPLDCVAAVGVGPGVNHQGSTHQLDPSTERVGIEVSERSEQVALDLVEDPRRDDRLVEIAVERGEQEVAGQHGDEDVGVEDCDRFRHVRDRAQS
jgi:hypothetical protein